MKFIRGEGTYLALKRAGRRGYGGYGLRGYRLRWNRLAQCCANTGCGEIGFYPIRVESALRRSVGHKYSPPPWRPNFPDCLYCSRGVESLDGPVSQAADQRLTEGVESQAADQRQLVRGLPWKA